MKLSVEKRYPFWSSIIIGVFCYFFFPLHLIPKNLDKIFPEIIQISALAIGFLSTSLALIFTLAKEWIIKALKELKKNKYYKIMIDYFIRAISASFIVALINACCLFLDWNNSDDKILIKVGFSLWISSLIGLFLSYYRIIRVFSWILKSTE